MYILCVQWKMVMHSKFAKILWVIDSCVYPFAEWEALPVRFPPRPVSVDSPRASNKWDSVIPRYSCDAAGALSVTLFQPGLSRAPMGWSTEPSFGGCSWYNSCCVAILHERQNNTPHVCGLKIPIVGFWTWKNQHSSCDTLFFWWKSHHKSFPQVKATIHLIYIR